MPETLSQNLADALRELLDEGYELTLNKAPGNCGYLADLVWASGLADHRNRRRPGRRGGVRLAAR